MCGGRRRKKGGDSKRVEGSCRGGKGGSGLEFGRVSGKVRYVEEQLIGSDGDSWQPNAERELDVKGKENISTNPGGLGGGPLRGNKGGGGPGER